MANDTDVLDLYCHDFSDENIVVNSTSRRVGSALSFSCEEGFELSGSSVITCDDPGEWSSSIPHCMEQASGNSQIVIIVVSAAAAAVALGVLLGTLYMLFTNFRKERKAKVKAQEFIDHLKELRIYQAVTQDCVGMPAVVYTNINATLRGRPSTSDESEDGSPAAASTTDAEMTSEKAFIY